MPFLIFALLCKYEKEKKSQDLVIVTSRCRSKILWLLIIKFNKQIYTSKLNETLQRIDIWFLFLRCTSIWSLGGVVDRRRGGGTGASMSESNQAKGR